MNEEHYNGQPHEGGDSNDQNKPVHQIPQEEQERILKQFESPQKPGGLKKKSLLTAYAYLPEYLFMLILLGMFIYAINSLFAVGIQSLAPPPMDSSDSSIYGGANVYREPSEIIDNFQLVTSLATLAVAFPLLIIFYLRTTNAEKDTPAIVSHRWRKAFLGGFIVVQLLTIVSHLFAMSYDLVSRAIDVESLNTAAVLFRISTGSNEWWQSVLTGLVSVGLIVFILVVVSKGYKAAQKAV